jgi:hypothetical protein
MMPIHNNFTLLLRVVIGSIGYVYICVGFNWQVNFYPTAYDANFKSMVMKYAE